MAGPHVFASVRSARRHLARQELAIEVPRTSGLSSAAAQKVGDFDRKLKREAWQAQAYNHANEIGELGYGLNLIGSVVGKGHLSPVEHDEDGNPVAPETDANGDTVTTPDRAKAQRVLHAFRGPEGDHRAMLTQGAVHDQIAGEGLLLGEPVEDQNAVSWELVSVLEVTQDEHDENKMTRKMSAGSGAMSVAHRDDKTTRVLERDRAYVSRYHRGDWAHSGDPTSSLRRNAAVCNEIILWTQLIETTIKSRLNAGIIFIPEEIEFPPDDDGPEDATDADRFLDVLVETISTPVTDRSNPASLAPSVSSIPAEYIEKIRLLSLTDGSLDIGAMLEARANALRRLAAGMDMPLEVLEGVGGTSHWNAAGIDVDFVKKHIIPLGERLARFFTVAYFRRMLVEFEGMSEDEAERWSLEYDGSDILTRMDQANSADGLWRDLLLSDAARVAAHSFDPDRDMPSAEERQRRLLERVAVAPSVNNRPLLPGVIDFEAFPELDPEMLEAFLAPQQQGAPPESDPPDPSSVDPNDEPVDTNPAGPDTPASGEPDADTLAVLERIRTAGSSALDLALQQAANQVVTQARRLPADVQDRLDQPHYRTGPRKAEVLRFLGDADWKAIQRTPKSLLRNKFAQFEQQTAFWLGDLYRTKGRATADEDARRVAALLSARLDELALSGFTRPIEREPGTGLSVPIALVAEVAAP